MTKKHMITKTQVSSFSISPKAQKISKKAFSIAEALIALLIGSLILGMSAPLITKQIKHNSMSDTQVQVLNQKLEKFNTDKAEDITSLQEEIKQLKNLLDKEEEKKDTTPVGVIVMWSGSSIPEGWALCNGQNGTPDLRDRFIVGAGASYGIGNVGGANYVTLTLKQIPPHRHGVMEYAGPAHSDTNLWSHIAAGVNGGSSGLTDYAGSGQAHENRPPYYALAYIMKIKAN